MALLQGHKSGYLLELGQSHCWWHWRSGDSWVELKWGGKMCPVPIKQLLHSTAGRERGKTPQLPSVFIFLIQPTLHHADLHLSLPFLVKGKGLPGLWTTTHEACIHFKWKILQTLTCLKHSNYYCPLPSLFPYFVLYFLPKQNLLCKFLCLISHVPSNTSLLIDFSLSSKFSSCLFFSTQNFFAVCWFWISSYLTFPGHPFGWH